jgi:RNA polymerase sigma-70 factor (ECF subfamily)
MSPGVDCQAAQLLDRARAGDAKTLGQLLEGYRAYLLVLARVQIGRRLQGKVDASDVVQEAFLGAYRDLPQFRGTSESEFLGWLRKILASLLANLVRHYQGTQRRDVPLERQLARELDQSSHALEANLQAPQSSPSQEASRREQSGLLAEALGRLPQEWRELLILRHLEGLSFPEVARRLGRSVDSVKKQWPRALAADVVERPRCARGPASDRGAAHAGSRAGAAHGGVAAGLLPGLSTADRPGAGAAFFGPGPHDPVRPGRGTAGGEAASAAAD